MTRTVRVAQLSDTHFVEPETAPEGGHGYDVSAAFDGVLDHLGSHDHLDMVAVTGDVADHGRPEQYEIAATALSRFEIPVNVCPGNHDFDTPFRAGVARNHVGVARVVEIESWAFLFVDSNTGEMMDDGAGGLIDPPGEDRLHSHGLLSESEVSWIQDACSSTDAPHVFIWLHHPPGVPVALFDNQPYAAQWRNLLATLPQVRGIGGGHTHIPARYELSDRPVIVAPSLKNNFDLDADTWLPPGYRSYEFGVDGSIRSDLHLLDDERWPRRPLGRALRSLFAGELTFEQLAEIVARRRAADG